MSTVHAVLTIVTNKSLSFVTSHCTYKDIEETYKDIEETHNCDFAASTG
jgi:hypothetical protein